MTLASYTSSLKCNTRQPQFEKLVHLIEPNDTLIVTKLDRFARNTREALNLIDDLLKEKIMIKVLNLRTIDNTSIGRMIVRTLLSVAEMERDMIIERTQAGKIFARRSKFWSVRATWRRRVVLARALLVTIYLTS